MSTKPFMQQVCVAAATACNLDNADAVVLHVIALQCDVHAVLRFLQSYALAYPESYRNTLRFWRLLANQPADAQSQDEANTSFKKLVQALRLIASTRGGATSPVTCNCLRRP